jgi:hypothetical protein
MYFDHIFPLPKIQDCATCSDYSPVRGSNKEEDTDARKEDEQCASSSRPLSNSMCQKE